MRLQDDIDFTTLTWVKAELDETLKQARHALEAYVEDPTDASQMRFCATYLHQVQGTLRMVELYGAAMATEEMEQLATALLGNAIEDRDDAYAVLMRGIVQLPDYLERLQTGYKDIPIVLLPLLNDLRAARGEKGLSESVLFSPELTRPLPSSASGPAEPLPDVELRRQAGQLRALFQLSLLKWFRNEDATSHGARLSQVCARLVNQVFQEDARRLFWVAGGLLEAMQAGAFEPNQQLKQTIGKVEREIKRLSEAGEASFRLDPPRELTRSLLYFVAHAPTEHARLVEIRRVFDLASLLPSEQELEHARGSISGHNRALLDTVSIAIKDDLMRVKDALDLHMRAQGSDLSGLASQCEVLTRVGDTLGMLGLGVPRRVVLEQRDILQQVTNGDRAADEAALLDIAGALLYVEASLDDQVQHLGTAAGIDEEASPGLPQAESRKVLETVVKEAQSNFSQAKQCFVAFVESNWDHAQLQDVPRLIDEVTGALRILELDEAPRYLVAIRTFTERELLDRRRVPNGQQMDTLADVLASLEYYLEALREHRPGRDKIVDVARERLETLGYWPIPELEAASPVPVAFDSPEGAGSLAEAGATSSVLQGPAIPPGAESGQLDAAVQAPELASNDLTAHVDTDGETVVMSADEAHSELEPESDIPPLESLSADAELASIAADAGADPGSVAPETETAQTGFGFDGASEDIDEEIREVFVEEVQEEIANLEEMLPRWKANPEHLESLKPIRRVFHTLKGSGRLVGAMALGEFSWQVENMLNRVLDQTIAPSPAVIALVDTTQIVLPQLLDALRGEGRVTADIEQIKQVAERISAGEQAWISAPAPLVHTDGAAEASAESGFVSPADAAGELDAALQALADGSDAGTVAGADDEAFEPDLADDAFDPAFREYARAASLADAALDNALDSADLGVDPREQIEADVSSFEVEISQADRSDNAGAIRQAEEEIGPSVGMRTAFSIDPVLFDILKTEVAGHLETVDSYLMDARTLARPVNDPLLRAVHTMSGAFAMTEVPHISEVVGPCESYIKRLLARREAPSADGLKLMSEVAAAIRLLMRALDEPTPHAPGFPHLAEQLAAIRDTLPEPTGPLLPMHSETEDALAKATVSDRADSVGAFADAAGREGVASAADASTSMDSVEVIEMGIGEVDVLDPAITTEMDAFRDQHDEADAAGSESLESFDFEAMELEVIELESSESAPVEDLLDPLAPAVAFEFETGTHDFVSEAELAEAIEAQSVEADAGTEAVATEAVETEAVETEAVETEAVETEAVETEAVETEAVETEAVEAEAVETEAVEAEAVEAEAVEAEAVETEAVEAEAVETEAVETEAVETEAVETEAVKAEAVEAEAVEAEAVEAEPIGGLEFEELEFESAEAALFADDELAFVVVDRDEADLSAPSPAVADEQPGASTEPAFDQLGSWLDEGAAGLAPSLLESHEFDTERMATAAIAQDEAVESAAHHFAERDFESAADTSEAEAEWAEAERAEAERAEAEWAEAERAEAERAEAERAEAERAEAERAEAERAEAEWAEAERAEAERAEAEWAEAERAEVERAEVERAEAERAEAERAEAERVEVERAEAERAEAERAEAERAEAERAEAERAEAERAEAEQAEAERAEAERAEAERAEAEQAEAIDMLGERVEVAELAMDSPQADLSAVDPDPDGPLDMHDMDEELLDIFLEEGVDILDHSDGLLAQLRDDLSNRELVVGLQRDLHTLKGGARMAGLPPIGDLGHAMESLLEAVAEGRRELRADGIMVLERSFDRLHSMVTRVGERRAIAMPHVLVACVDALVRGEALPLEGMAVAAGADPNIGTIAPLPRVQLPTMIDEAEEDEPGVRAPQEQIRIRADLLDRLVNYAGEVAIYRARLEQQLGSFRGSLAEMEQTTARLREQLRRLEIETEAQIIARYQREGEEVEREFDPLELDRFSTLQQLSRALSESAADLTNLQATLEEHTRQYETLLLQQSRVSSDLQEGLMRTRMVPFDALVPRLRRILRQTAGELGKKAQLRVDGAQGEMDRTVLERMTAPLEHILRNAIAHGLETPEDRAAAGKPEEGTVRINFTREGSEVVIRATDDGRGMDRDAIRRKAIQRGLMDADAQLSDRDLYGFVLESGFSTAETVSKIAGRGVGMDVVSSEIKQLGGSLHIESELGRGTEFVIRLPFTLAVTQAVFVKLLETQFAVPISSVQGVARIAPAELAKQLASEHPAFEYAGELYQIQDLGLLLGQHASHSSESLQVPLLLARSGDLRAAICVDQVIGSREIVVKPTGPQISSIPGIFGATVMGDGSVVVILDVAPLVRRAVAHRLSGEETVKVEEVAKRQIPLVMVVDDSITMRKVTGRVLERAGYEVMTAKDGVDALEKLNDRIPNVMLLDIEMPRMDGYELATHMRNDTRLRDIPIIMITSRTGEKHRQRAFEIGVDRYLGKPYQEAELMRNVEDVMHVSRGKAG
jgi:chemosensory pili system protein ChpA (sensor histidine kinase/response regulator)